MERNVIFNEDDVLTTNDIAIIPGNALAEGERDKIIQNPTPNANKSNVNQPKPEAEKANTPDPEPTNSIPFPSEPHQTDEPEEVTMEEDELPQLGRGRRVQKKPPGAYRRMAEAKPPLVASVAEFDLDDDEENKIFPEDDDATYLQTLPYLVEWEPNLNHLTKHYVVPMSKSGKPLLTMRSANSRS